MSNRIFVVDTSYLLELYKVGREGTGNCWTEAGHTKITAQFDKENNAASRFYFPIPVLFEFANHIADANNRQQVSKHLIKLIESCLDEDIFYFITPCSSAESIKDFIQDLLTIINRFNTEFVQQKLGLTDASIIAEAERLAEKYKRSGCKVHIWTTHKELKAREPDTE